MKAHCLLILTFFLNLTPWEDDKTRLKFELTNQHIIFYLLIIKASLMKSCKTKIKLTIHTFSLSFILVGFLPDFIGSFSCIGTLYLFAKLVTIPFFLRELLGNTFSALLRERCLVDLCLNYDGGASVSSLVGACEGWSKWCEYIVELKLKGICWAEF